MKSINGGETWSLIGEELNFVGVNTLIIDPTETDTLFVGTYDGVFKSNDGGENWFKMKKGPTNPKVSALAIDPNNRIIYAGTAGSSVFRYDFDRFGTVKKDQCKKDSWNINERWV